MQPDIVQIIAQKFEHFDVEPTSETVAIWFDLQGGIATDWALIFNDKVFHIAISIIVRRSPTMLQDDGEIGTGGEGIGD